ncbi:MAG: GGDEF domain-containing protein [Betaproteobacteria bacterium]|nr:GGDEF domain-containing protein [Betaproteobacteria bacterium]
MLRPVFSGSYLPGSDRANRVIRSFFMDPIAALEREVDAAGDDAARLDALNRYAVALARAGDAPRALTQVERAEAIAARLNDEAGRGRALCTRGICLYLRAEYIAGLQCCLDACAIAEAAQDPSGLAGALLSAAACHYQMGTLEEAHTALMEALGMLELVPDDGLAFRAHNTLGAILMSKQKYTEAMAHLDAAIAIARRSEDDFDRRRAEVNRASVLHKMGVAACEAGRDSEAAAHFRAGIETCERIRASIGPPSVVRDAASCAGTLGALYVSTGRWEEAWTLFEEVVNHGRDMANSHVQAEALMHLGKLHILRGAFLQARDCLDQSMQLASGVNVQHLIAKAHEGLAEWCEARGDYREALAQYRHFMEIHEVMLRRELDATARARAIWVQYQQARRDADAYRMRAERLSARNAELAAAADRHQRDALYDALTGLANRRHLDARLAELVAEMRDGETLALALIDVDAFKHINDTFTHTLGDAVLKAVAEGLREACRGADLPARFGGDEFVLVLPGTSVDGARQMLERLRVRMDTRDWSTLDPALAVTLSIGVTELRAGDSVESIVRRADEALYAAKKQGRNRVLTG